MLLLSGTNELTMPSFDVGDTASYTCLYFLAVECTISPKADANSLGRVIS